MDVERESVSRIVEAAVTDVNDTLPPDERLEWSPSARVTGQGGVLNSLGVVSFVLAVEERVNEAFGTQLALFDESLVADIDGPFRTIESTVDHVCEVVRRA